MLLMKVLFKARLRRGYGLIKTCFCSGAELCYSVPKRHHRDSEKPRLTESEREPLTRESKSRAQKQVCQLVLDQFDSQYKEELGEQWDSARNILLDPHSWQYGVLLNRFSDLTNVRSHLKSLGYYSLHTQHLSCSIHDSLECLIHKDAVRLPTQRHHPGWLKQYYLLNAASVLPVLALDLRDGEKVLDMCSAPGGKALALLQAATPGLLYCNEVNENRYEWLLKTLESYIPSSLLERINVTNMDGRAIGSSHPNTYDKVLVDAPCSNDRSWLFTPVAQQGELWLRERAHLPHLQKELLCSALAAVRPGGLVVYSTCTLSHAENQSVIEGVLASCPGVELVDLEEELIDFLSRHFTFAYLQPPLGHLVIPEHGRTWGPMFVCRLKKVY